jgi:hypothetical protein
LEQLERILASPGLESAPSLRRLLRYVVEETLEGRGGSLKEYTLGTSVFGRGEHFNPRIDPIVRVQARNLRTRLAQYYAGPGVSDAVIIELPKGTYVPVFHFQAEPEHRTGWIVTAALAAAALLAVVGLAMVEGHHQVAMPSPQHAQPYLAP